MGTIYQVSRSLVGPDGRFGPFEVIAISGTKTFTDQSVPAGTSSLIYKIVAIRSTTVGPAATFIVNMGVHGASARPGMTFVMKRARAGTGAGVSLHVRAA